MADAINQPPPLETRASGDVTTESLANLLEWFLKYDERVAIMRHPQIEALFQWKQQDSKAFGEDIYPFESAEDRFAVGIFQALAENNTKELLHEWLTDLLNALQQAKETNAQVVKDYKLSDTAYFRIENTDKDPSPLDVVKLIPSTVTQRLYLTACWLETLCIAETRVIGWVFQQLYDERFAAKS